MTLAQLSGSPAHSVSACQRTVPKYPAPSSREHHLEIRSEPSRAAGEYSVSNLHCSTYGPPRPERALEVRRTRGVRVVAGFVARDARRCLAGRVISAESLEPALTLRDAKTKAGQNPPQFVYADPDVICPRDGFDVSQSGLLKFYQKRSSTLLCGHGVVWQEVTAIQVALGQCEPHARRASDRDPCRCR